MSVAHQAAEQTHAEPGKAKAGAAAAPGKQTRAQDAKTSSAPSPSGINLSTLQEFISRHEGYRDVVYLDSRGFPTAGIGHLLTGSHPPVGSKVSKEQITEWFKQDVAKAMTGAKQDIGPAFDKLDEARKIVVIDMVFNLGSGGFGGFHQTIAAIRAGEFSQAATDMLQSAWAGQVGSRATEDAAIMRSGNMSGAGGSTGGGKAGGAGGAKGDAGDKAPSLASVRDGHGVLKQGEQGAAVKQLQQLLHVSADGDFGPATKAAVEKFQRVHHLAVDGVVGKMTLEALEPKSTAKKEADKPPEKADKPEPSTGGVAPTGGVKAPADKGDKGDKKEPKKDGWSPAPTLAAIKAGTAVLHEGERGPAVKDVQKLVGVGADGEFGPATKAAVEAFQHQHKMQRHDGEVDAHTLDLITKNPAGSIKGESRDGTADRSKLLSIARSGSVGKRPDGYCYKHICEFLVAAGGYGKITNPYTQFPSGDLPYAHDFADLMNSSAGKKFGLEKLSISNPYDAPSGSIVVVAAGSPGTANPVAGDITVADGNGAFYNGGEMAYGGRQGWAASRSAKLLGCYVPK